MPRSQRQTLRRGHGEGTIFQRADGRWVPDFLSVAIALESDFRRPSTE